MFEWASRVDTRETADGKDAMSKHRLRVACLALVALSMGAAGCTAIPAGNGVRTGVYFTGRSAESIVQGDLPVLEALTRAVLADMGVAVGASEAEVNDLELEIRGTGPDGRAVHVELEEDADGNTRVRASARTNAVDWDREYARIIVERIVERSYRGADPSARIFPRTSPYSRRRPALRGGHPSAPSSHHKPSSAPAAHPGGGGTPSLTPTRPGSPLPGLPRDINFVQDFPPGRSHR